MTFSLIKITFPVIGRDGFGKGVAGHKSVCDVEQSRVPGETAVLSFAGTTSHCSDRHLCRTKKVEKGTASMKTTSQVKPA